MLNFLIVVLALIAFILIVKYRFQIHNFTGDFAFAEKYLGSGGSVTFIVLAAILLFFGSIMYVTGALQSIMLKLTGGFF